MKVYPTSSLRMGYGVCTNFSKILTAKTKMCSLVAELELSGEGS
jgi:hypothetical protein